MGCLSLSLLFREAPHLPTFSPKMLSLPSLPCSPGPFTNKLICLQQKKKKRGCWAKCSGLLAKVLALQALGFHMRMGSCPSCSTSCLTPCLWPGKAGEDGILPWDPAPAWETWRRFLAPGFRLAQHRLLRTFGE